MPRARLGGFALAFCAAFWLAASPSIAEAAKAKTKKKAPPKAAPSPEAEARRLYGEGLRFFSSGQFEKALASYTSAYEKAPLPELLFNIAQCHRNLGHYEESIFFYRKFLSEVPDTPLVDNINLAISEMEAAAAAAKKREADKIAAEKAASLAAAEAGRKAAAEAEALRAADAAKAARLAADAEEARLSAVRASRPFYQRAWFWGVIGGVLVLAGGAAAGGWYWFYGRLPAHDFEIDCMGCTPP